MRRALPVLAMIVLLAAPVAGCSGHSGSSGRPAPSGTGSGVDLGVPSGGASDPSVDPSLGLDGGQPVPDASAASAALAKSKVGPLMKKLACTNQELVETDPLSLETGMCQLSGDIIVNVFATAAKRDEWVHQAIVSGLGTVVGPLWAVGVEVDTDTPVVVAKLGGTAN